MPNSFTNDNSLPPSPEHCNAQGQAAILLVESLIHALIDRSVITVETAVEVIDAALEVSEEIDEQPADQKLRQGASTLLKAMSRSFRTDLPRT